MTRKQIQNEILKQFKRRLRREYGRWQDLWTLETIQHGVQGQNLITLNFDTEFTHISIIFDNCLNVSVLVTGSAELACCLRPFLDVADECVNYIHWQISYTKLHAITYGYEKGE